MKLIYLGKELDSSKEHELFSNHEFGFMVVIKYLVKDKVEVLNNYTEVHYKYQSYLAGEKIAFESDILQTGFIREIKGIESVDIQYDTQIWE